MLLLRRLPLPVLLSLASSAAFAHAGRASTNTLNKTAFVVSGTGAIRNVNKSDFSSTLSSAINASDSNNNNIDSQNTMTVDKDYPGTAVERMMAVRARVAQLTEDDLHGPWEDVRRKLLWAGGLKDLTSALPGQGYTGHAFNDYNHVDLTCMAEQVSNNLNDGSVREIAVGNLLGPGIRTASIAELGPGGSWSTCANGCNQNPPQDVAHVQFRSRIAFKLVWVPPTFDSFVLVDDDGTELARGTPSGTLPDIRQRQRNFAIVQGSKYSKATETVAASNSVSD